MIVTFDVPIDFQCTSWDKHAQFGHVRDVSFQHPIKLYFGTERFLNDIPEELQLRKISFVYFQIRDWL